MEPAPALRMRLRLHCKPLEEGKEGNGKKTPIVEIANCGIRNKEEKEKSADFGALSDTRRWR